MARIYVASNMMMMMGCRGNVQKLSLGHAIVQALSHRHFVAKIWAQLQASPCGI
jgi:hypothetical protein